MLNVTRKDKIKNEVKRSKTQVKDIIKNVQNMKGQWAGHLARMNNNKWAKKTTEWTPREGNRTKGKPKRRWRDDIEEKAESTWTRVEWHKIDKRGSSCGGHLPAVSGEAEMIE